MTPGGHAPKGSDSPGSKAVGAGMDSKQLLDEEGTSNFRCGAGIVMYIVLDRPDVQYTARAVMMDMAHPTRQGLARLKRAIRYLSKYPVLVRVFSCGGVRPLHLDVMTDSD